MKDIVSIPHFDIITLGDFEYDKNIPKQVSLSIPNEPGMMNKFDCNVEQFDTLGHLESNVLIVYEDCKVISTENIIIKPSRSLIKTNTESNIKIELSFKRCYKTELVRYLRFQKIRKIRKIAHGKQDIG